MTSNQEEYLSTSLKNSFGEEEEKSTLTVSFEKRISVNK